MDATPRLTLRDGAAMPPAYHLGLGAPAQLVDRVVGFREVEPDTNARGARDRWTE